MDRTLDQEFQVAGQFWLPDKPDHRVAGTFTYSKSAMELTLHGRIGENMLGQAGLGERFPRVYGIAMDGARFTLLNAYVKSASCNSTGMIGAVLSSIYLVHGSHTPGLDDLRVCSLSLSCNCLNAFLAINPFERSLHKRDMSIAYKHPEPIVYRVAPIETTLSFGLVTSYERGQMAAGFRSTSVAELKPDQPRSIQWFMETVWRLCDLVTLLSDEPTRPTGLQVMFDNADPSDGWLLYAAPRPTEEEKLHPAQLLFSFPAIRGSFSTMLERWFSADQCLVTSTRLFRDAHRKFEGSADRFLHATKSLEAFSRSQGTSTYMSADSYQHIVQKICDTIPVEVSDDHRVSLRRRIQFGNEHSLRKRITSLVGSLSATAQAVVCSVPKDFAAGIVNTRNYLTHYSEDPDTIPLGEADRLWACEKLLILMRLALLKYIGLEEECIVARMKTHYRRLQQYIDLWKKYKERP